MKNINPGIKREWRSVPGLRTLIAAVEPEIGQDTRPIMSKVTVHMIPLTFAQFDLGRQDIVVEGEQRHAGVRGDDHRVYRAGRGIRESPQFRSPGDTTRPAQDHVWHHSLILVVVPHSIFVFIVI